MHYFFTFLFVFFIIGCGSSNTTTTPEENNITTGTCDNQIQEPVSNLGNAMNTLGYYGDGVYFGKESVVGTWSALDNVSPRMQFLTFEEDGTGEEWTIHEKVYIYNYGVNEDGTIMYYIVGPTINTLTIIGYEDCCYTIKHEFNHEDSEKTFLYDTYKLCTISQEEFEKYK